MLSKFFPVPYSNSKWDAFLPYMLLNSISISIIKMTSSINAFSYLTSSPKNKFLNRGVNRKIFVKILKQT